MADTDEQGNGLGGMDWLTGGWGSLAEQTEADDEAAEAAILARNEARLEQFRRDKLFHDWISRGPGPECMHILREATIEQPCFFPARHPLAGGGALELPATEQGLVREGQNSVVRDIQDRAKRAERGPPDLEPLPDRTEGTGDE